jgi:glycosyltransferase involved in cell wall biosynthesis
MLLGEESVVIGNSTPAGTVDDRRAMRVAWVGDRPAPALVEALTAHPGLQVAYCGSDLARVLAGRPDVVHCRRDALGLLATLDGAAPNFALVLDLSEVHEPALGRREARAARRADLVLLGSPAHLDRLRHRDASLAARAEVFYRPVDVSFYAPEDVLMQTRQMHLRRFRRFHRLGARAVLFAGPYTEAGGLDLVLEAVIDLRREHKDLRLTAIPLGPIDQRYLDRCEQRALELGHHGVLEWTVAPEELPFWFATGTVVCLPSRVPLGSRPALLAAAAGRPFVGSDIGAFWDTVAPDGRDLLLTDTHPRSLAAAIEPLLCDEEGAARRGAAARRYAVDEFSFDAGVQRAFALWTSLRLAK